MKLALLALFIGCSVMEKAPVAIIQSHPLKGPDVEKEGLPAPLAKLLPQLTGQDFQHLLKQLQGDEGPLHSLVAMAKIKVKEGGLSPQEREDYLKFFLMALKSPLGPTKAASLWGIGQLGTMDDMRVLIVAMEDENSAVADEAASSLETLFNREQTTGPVRRPASENHQY